MREGRACVILAGRRAGQKATITKIISATHVMIKTEKGKERKASVSHIRPL